MNLFSYFRLAPKATRNAPDIQRARGIAGVDHRNAVAAFEAVGFWVLREEEHVVMTDGVRILTIPRHDPINALTMDGIVRDAGLSVDKFRDLC
jgi:hypothetical protein